MQRRPLITILGRPNVGKSTLFNRLIGEKKSIVSSIEGVTRDRVYGQFEWLGDYYDIVDTGGFIPGEKDIMNTNIRIQLDIARQDSDFILFLVDGKSEITSSDLELAQQIRISKKKFQLVVNKLDSLKDNLEGFDYYNLGLGEPIFISAEQGRNVGDLLDEISDHFPNEDIKEKEEACINLAIVGMPNVGKSSLMNRLLNEDKSIVTSLPGTTRDPIDSYIKYYGNTYRLIDTAGIRKKNKLLDDIEYYSIVRSLRAINESDITAVIIDIDKGFNKQDRNIIDYVIDKGKGLTIIVNKWDLMEKDTHTMDETKLDIIDTFPHLQYYPIIFISVKNNLRVRNVLKHIRSIHADMKKKVKTAELNVFIERITRLKPPPSVKGKFLKIKYITQISTYPVLFAVYCNHPHLFPENYRRYIDNSLRKTFNFRGIPIRISFRKK